MEEMFDIEKFNVISDEENYYFFRSLEPGDIKDLEEGNIKDENGKYIRLRTDRERWEETHNLTPRWNAESQVTLEEMYNHIKTPYSLETNCISLSSNANVARTYGETFSDKYVMIKVPKKEMGQRVYNAGQYMLSEIARKVQERIAQGNIPEEVLEDLKKIDEATKPEDLKEIIKVKYTAPKGIDTSKSGMKKGIVYKAPLSRISSFQALNDEQTLEKNKIVAKLTILEQKGLMKPAVSRIKTNSELIKTMGSAFASGEQIYYGDIEGDRIADISKELLDMFALIQQAENQDKQIVNELKTELVKYITKGGKLEIPEESLLRDEGTPRTDISIEEMYELTAGKVEYGQANSIDIDENMIKQFEKGIVLKDHICCPAIIEVQDTHTAFVTITEGKYHQIKRMFGCFGAKVLELHRITMGNLNLPADISEGCCREITEQEMKLLKEV